MPGDEEYLYANDLVRTLEKNFEVANKLEPERKMQLARALGLQPRQVAIWFQNRRARYKSKLIEEEFSKLRAAHDAVVVHNCRLEAEVQRNSPTG